MLVLAGCGEGKLAAPSGVSSEPNRQALEAEVSAAAAQPGSGSGSGSAAPGQGPRAGGGTDPTSGGTRVAWVRMRDRANLAAARSVDGWRARGQAVHNELRATASRSQASVRTFLSQRGVPMRPFYIANVIRIEADQATIDTLAARSDVAEVLPDHVYAIPPVERSSGSYGVLTTEWGLDSIRAPEAWDAFGLRGEGIVVATIDTGVQFDHPALVAQYRGTQGGGAFDHNYNWFDPSSVCGMPSNEPCDNAGHGTHVTGTMVGDDGDPGDNQVGVAPHAKWIAAKGCEDFFCSTEALLASAEWLLAPTDLNGQNPRTDLRPNIINNSWGGGSGDPFFQEAVDAWVAAGIFPAFAAGNNGPGCGSATSPGDYPSSYAAGAYDMFGNIADFSGRGPSAFGVGKPNLAAPGVDVRSSVPGNGYDFFSGTSMASPHLAGTVALMWSAAPSLIGDIASTRALLDSTAIDTEDSSCGGDAANNFVWGEGRLDAFAAVDASPRGPTGNIAGLIQDQSGPIVGATIRSLSSDGRTRTATSRADGTYNLRLAIGFYDLTVSAFGYVSQSVSGVEVTEDATTDQSFTLELAPAHAVSGTVVDQDGAPLGGAEVSIVGTPITPVVTDASGQYAFASVPEGSYQIHVAPSRCYAAQTQDLVVDGEEIVDFALDTRFDTYGYSCAPVAFEYVEASDLVSSYADYELFSIELPFPFTYYGRTHENLGIAADGYVTFTDGLGYSEYWNSPIPSTWEPNDAIYALWDDLYTYDGTGGIYTQLLGTEPERTFVIEWRNMYAYEGTGEPLSFEIVLHENGAVALQYGSDGATGATATLGIENETGTDGLQYSYNEPSVGNGQAILYSLPPSGIVRGLVTDFNDGLPIAGAVIGAYQGDTLVRAARSNTEGRYQLQLPVGDYVVRASLDRYASGEVALHVAENGFYTADFALQSARAVVTPSTVQLVTTAGQVRTRTLTLGNEGSINLEYEISEAGGRRQAVASRARQRNAAADILARDTRGLYQTTAARGWAPDAVGDVLHSFPTGLGLGWGVGFTSKLWLSDVFARTNNEFEVDGTPTGVSFGHSWGEWGADMAYDGSRDLICQLAVGGDGGIHCFSPTTGEELESIVGSFPWVPGSQRGLAYNPSDDTFYVGGWWEGIVYHIQGLSHPEPGAVIEQCSPSDPNISGLAWNDAMQVLWVATNSETDTIYEINPQDCTVLATIAHPEPGYSGAGIEIDADGNLWTMSQYSNTAFLLESGVPSFSDVPWLSVTPASGSLAPGATQALTVTVDTSGLTPGIYLASIFVRSNSGREGALRIPVSVVVSAYLQAANAGGSAYTDVAGDAWAADRAHTNGSWGYMQRGSTKSSNRAIAGTDDDRLYQNSRIDPYAYRYDNVPNGIYEVDLRFAELENIRFGRRLYDVIVENTLVLPSHDIAYEVGTYTADDHRFFVEVTDGRLDVRFVARSRSEKPLVNALRVTHRPDR